MSSEEVGGPCRLQAQVPHRPTVASDPQSRSGPAGAASRPGRCVQTRGEASWSGPRQSLGGRAGEVSSGREGRRRGGQNSSSGVGSKMATGKAGDRWSLSAAELEKWGKGKEEINISTVRNLKINPKP